MIDPDKNFDWEFNFKNEYYRNDSPQLWSASRIPTLVTKVGYCMNSYGYRCDEFNLKSELPIVFMGCSHTFGLAVPIEDTWAYRTVSNIRDKTKKTIPYWNLARNGSSVDLQFWNLDKHIDKLKPQFIIFLVPPMYRRNIVFQNNFHQFSVNENKNLENELPLELQKTKGLLVDESYALFEIHKYFILINALCEKYGTQLLFQFSDEDDTSGVFFKNYQSKYTKFKQLKTLWHGPHLQKYLDYARDGMHRGPISNAAFADELWTEINQYFD